VRELGYHIATQEQLEKILIEERLLLEDQHRTKNSWYSVFISGLPSRPANACRGQHQPLTLRPAPNKAGHNSIATECGRKVRASRCWQNSFIWHLNEKIITFAAKSMVNNDGSNAPANVFWLNNCCTLKSVERK